MRLGPGVPWARRMMRKMSAPAMRTKNAARDEENFRASG